MVQYPRFLNRLDKSAWRAVMVTLGLFAGVIGIFILGKTGVFGTFEGVQAMLEELRGSPWGLPVIIAVFCLAAFLGIPQFGLIAATVVAFGPWLGFGYSWIATLVSGVITFWSGRLAGEQTFRRYAGGGANRMSEFIGRNGFLASLLVRIVPTAPFVVVNMAFGVSHTKFLHYMAGLAIGVLPKTALVAFAGQSLISALTGSPWMALLAAFAAAAAWIVVMLIARRSVRS
ncbi:MAG: VTT domain-containing protein [Hyphomonadaceae bacterium]